MKHIWTIWSSRSCTKL